MPLIKDKLNFDAKNVEQLLKRENKFIIDLFSVTAVPDRISIEENVESDENIHKFKFNSKGKKTTRAKSLQELQQRLEGFTNRKKLTYKEKLEKKGLKNRLKKKSQKVEKNAKQKLARAAKLSTEVNTPNSQDVDKSNTSSVVFNSQDKIVYTKFDFANLGKRKKVKQEKDPKKLLKNMEEQKQLLQKLEESGDKEKAIKIKEKTAWKNALAKAEGQKVKDDPVLLKKAVVKKEQKQRSSKKKWEQRIEGVKKAKEERQKKRTESILKRKQEKKHKKLKQGAKRGKIIPGY